MITHIYKKLYNLLSNYYGIIKIITSVEIKGGDIFPRFRKVLAFLLCFSYPALPFLCETCTKWRSRKCSSNFDESKRDDADYEKTKSVSLSTWSIAFVRDSSSWFNILAPKCTRSARCHAPLVGQVHEMFRPCTEINKQIRSEAFTQSFCFIFFILIYITYFWALKKMLSRYDGTKGFSIWSLGFKFVNLCSKDRNI